MVPKVTKWLCQFIIIGETINSFGKLVFGQSDEYDYIVAPSDTLDYYDPSDQLAMEIEVQPYNGMKSQRDYICFSLKYFYLIDH